MAIAKGPYVELGRHPECAHLIVTALMGRTAECLREYGLTPTDNVRENARLHLRLHSPKSGQGEKEHPRESENPGLGVGDTTP